MNITEIEMLGDNSPDLYRYIWILERNDHYPDQNIVNEDSLLMPYTGLWYTPHTKRKNNE